MISRMDTLTSKTTSDIRRQITGKLLGRDAPCDGGGSTPSHDHLVHAAIRVLQLSWLIMHTDSIGGSI